ncbi:unnamed protein product [Vicia faba]|uniref:Uncharacterized protein n=1 Tax=Vicia faba TaxID=3906 RepID=A0AAV1A0M9_VICFA|nr:unnamed protein product [Vicia faba]
MVPKEEWPVYSVCDVSAFTLLPQNVSDFLSRDLPCRRPKRTPISVNQCIPASFSHSFVLLLITLQILSNSNLKSENLDESDDERGDERCRSVMKMREEFVVGASAGTKLFNGLEGASTGCELFNALQTQEVEFALI